MSKTRNKFSPEVRERAVREEQIDMLRRHQGTHLTGIIARLAENAAGTMDFY